MGCVGLSLWGLQFVRGLVCEGFRLRGVQSVRGLECRGGPVCGDLFFAGFSLWGIQSVVSGPVWEEFNPWKVQSVECSVYEGHHP